MTPAEQIQQAWEAATHDPIGDERDDSPDDHFFRVAEREWPAVWQSLAEKDAALAAAVKERDQWKAKAEELSVWEPRLLGVEGGVVSIAVAKHVSALLAGSMLTLLDDVNAPNYVEVAFSRGDEDGRPEYRVTFHRPGGKTPHQLKEEAVAERDALRAIVDWVKSQLPTRWSFSDDQRHTHTWHTREDFLEALAAKEPHP